MIYKLEPFEDFILTSKVKVELKGQSHFYQFVPNLLINVWSYCEPFLSYQRFLFDLQGHGDKFDLRGHRSLFGKVAQLNEKYCLKGLMKISWIVYELEPFKDFILTSEVKDHFHKFVQNWPINLCTKFGEATVSSFWVIEDFIWAKSYVLHMIRPILVGSCNRKTKNYKIWNIKYEI